MASSRYANHPSDGNLCHVYLVLLKSWLLLHLFKCDSNTTFYQSLVKFVSWEMGMVKEHGISSSPSACSLLNQV